MSTRCLLFSEPKTIVSLQHFSISFFFRKWLRISVYCEEGNKFQSDCCLRFMQDRAMAQVSIRQALAAGTWFDPGHFIWDLWYRKLPWERVSSECVGFVSLSVTSHPSPRTIFMLIQLLLEVQKCEAWDPSNKAAFFTAFEKQWT